MNYLTNTAVAIAQPAVGAVAKPALGVLARPVLGAVAQPVFGAVAQGLVGPTRAQDLINLNQAYLKDESYQQYLPLKYAYEQFHTSTKITRQTNFTDTTLRDEIAEAAYQALLYDSIDRMPPQQQKIIDLIEQKTHEEFNDAWAKMEHWQSDLSVYWMYKFDVYKDSVSRDMLMELISLAQKIALFRTTVDGLHTTSDPGHVRAVQFMQNEETKWQTEVNRIDALLPAELKTSKIDPALQAQVDRFRAKG